MGKQREIKHQICRAAVTRHVPVTVSVMHFRLLQPFSRDATFGFQMHHGEGCRGRFHKTADDSMKETSLLV